MIHSVNLTGKTLKGKNRIREAGTNHWIVLREADEVVFSVRPGPWLFVTPDANKQDFSRWVQLADDPDFIVEVIR